MKTTNRWEWTHIVNRYGPRKNPVRHLVNVLAVEFMDDNAVCFPARDVLAFAMGCSLKTAERAIAIAEREGWLIVGKKRRSGRAWCVNEYHAAIPEGLEPWRGVTDPQAKWRQLMASKSAALPEPAVIHSAKPKRPSILARGDGANDSLEAA